MLAEHWDPADYPKPARIAMNLVKFRVVDYPESDRCPMAESDDHREAMFRVIELLKNHYRNQQAYVSGDLLVYYEQGNAQKFVVPDAFVAKGSRRDGDESIDCGWKVLCPK